MFQVSGRTPFGRMIIPLPATRRPMPSNSQQPKIRVEGNPRAP